MLKASQSFVWTKHRNVTEGQTDRQTYRRSALQAMRTHCKKEKCTHERLIIYYQDVVQRFLLILEHFIYFLFVTIVIGVIAAICQPIFI